VVVVVSRSSHSSAWVVPCLPLHHHHHTTSAMRYPFPLIMEHKWVPDAVIVVDVVVPYVLIFVHRLVLYVVDVVGVVWSEECAVVVVVENRSWYYCSHGPPPFPTDDDDDDDVDSLDRGGVVDHRYPCRGDEYYQY
jgi:hypothetical protein